MPYVDAAHIFVQRFLEVPLHFLLHVLLLFVRQNAYESFAP
jgi:hypothetical protein